MLNPNANGAVDAGLGPLLVFPSLYQRPPSTAQLRQCRQLFYWGFLLLPGLWLLNYCRFNRLAKEARGDDDGVAEMRTYVRWSLVGCIFIALLLLVQPHATQRPLQPFDPLYADIAALTHSLAHLLLCVLWRG